jgi:predicted AlkP superfamily phosphohydrolase/phosphomutase
MGRNRVFILGLDGATLDLMLPMIDRGKLPTFGMIMKKGVYGRLHSVRPPLSPPAWISFSTGQRPGKHGILGFTTMIPNSYSLKLVSGLDNRARTIWEMSGLAGKKVIVLNIPMTYPPKAVNGLLISGLDTPDIYSDFTYPPHLKREILERFPQYRINLHLGGYLHTDRRRSIALRMIHEYMDLRFRVAEYLMENYPWDLFIVKFNNPDIVQHHFWKYMDPAHPLHEPDSPDDFKSAIFTVYEKLDEIASSLLNKLPGHTTFMAISDHGAGPRINKTVYVNEWLKENGYLSVLDRAGSDKFTWRRALSGRLRRSFRRTLAFLVRNTSPDLRIFMKRHLPETFSRLSLRFKFSDGLSAIDWSKTTAFLAEQDCIRINSKGVYPQGVVEPRDYFRVRNEIIHKLSGLRDSETGETVFQSVLSREDAFGVSGGHTLPDVQLVPRDAKYDVSGRWLPEDRHQTVTCLINEGHPSGANGMHRPDGILFISGPFCRSGLELGDLNITDVCPTALFLLGVPIPKDLDGRVILEAFHDAFSKYCPVQYSDYREGPSDGRQQGDVYSAEETTKIVDHLKSLGYME